MTAEFVTRSAVRDHAAEGAGRDSREQDGADFAYSLAELGRFRVNVMRQLNGMGAVFRAIPSKALTMDELKLPEVGAHAGARATTA